MAVQLTHSEIQNSQHSLDIILIAEDIISPANYGMMIRTAEAFGVTKVIFISPEYTELTPKMKKTSRSAEKYLDIVFEKNIDAVLEHLKNEDYTILALERTDDCISINDFKTTNDKIVLITGSESLGVSEKALAKCDLCVEIPMYGTNSSMNLVVATGVALNQLTIQKTV